MRFSAFYACVNGRSIEQQYQAAIANGEAGLTWRQAKGHRAVNAADCAALYAQLWDQYIAEHPELLDILRSATGLSDMFGQPNHCCQATELWRIRNQRRGSAVHQKGQ